MEIRMHPSVQKVAEFMQQELPVDELRGVAEALAVIAPAIWGRYPDVEVASMVLGSEPINEKPRIP